MTDTSPPFTDRLVFLDTETVTLDPQPGSVWEIAVMLPDDDTPRVTQVQPDLSAAEPKALEVGRFAYRYRYDLALRHFDDVRAWCRDNIPEGSVIVGSNPQFDTAHLGQFYGPKVAPWHYHPCDLPSLVAGATGRWPDADGSLSLKWAAETVGIDPDGYERHTAAGDVLLARDIWRQIAFEGA